MSHWLAAPPHPTGYIPPSPHLERAVGGQVQGEARVGEEEVQAPKVEQVVLADLAGKHLEGGGIHHRVQQHHLQREGGVGRRGGRGGMGARLRGCRGRRATARQLRERATRVPAHRGRRSAGTRQPTMQPLGRTISPRRSSRRRRPPTQSPAGGAGRPAAPASGARSRRCTAGGSSPQSRACCGTRVAARQAFRWRLCGPKER